MLVWLAEMLKFPFTPRCPVPALGSSVWTEPADPVVDSCSTLKCCTEKVYPIVTFDLNEITVKAELYTFFFK